MEELMGTGCMPPSNYIWAFNCRGLKCTKLCVSVVAEWQSVSCMNELSWSCNVSFIFTVIQNAQRDETDGRGGGLHLEELELAGWLVRWTDRQTDVCVTHCTCKCRTGKDRRRRRMDDMKALLHDIWMAYHKNCRRYIVVIIARILFIILSICEYIATHEEISAYHSSLWFFMARHNI